MLDWKMIKREKRVHFCLDFLAVILNKFSVFQMCFSDIVFFSVFFKRHHPHQE